MSLTPEELDRHRRHILLKEIGGPGVQKLRAAHVSIIGAGALGGPCALYLAAAGVGRIDLWDDDRVERSNLQRQVQFTDKDVGAPKAETLAARLQAMLAKLGIAIHFADMLGFGTEIIELGNRALHTKSHLVLAHTGADFRIAASLKFLFIEGVYVVDNASPLRFLHPLGIIEKEDGIAFGAQLHSLMNTG